MAASTVGSLWGFGSRPVTASLPARRGVVPVSQLVSERGLPKSRLVPCPGFRVFVVVVLLLFGWGFFFGGFSSHAV